jgi:hypothetical protein
LKKRNKDSADGKTSEKRHLGGQQEGDEMDVPEKGRDEEESAMGKVLEEVAAEEGNESPLHGDGSGKSSKEDIRRVKA